jgi:ABC-type branched-subunit amino acid transport system substrate-binding protein
MLLLTTSLSANEIGITKNQILLGQSAAFKGTSAALGAELWRGANAYFSYINSIGGIKGKKIQVLAMDDGYEGKRTLANTIELVQDKKVFALFGYVGTPTIVDALPAIQKFSANGVFLFSNFTGAQPQRETPHNKYVFNIRSSYREEADGLIENFLRIGKKKIALFIQHDAYGRSGSSAVARAITQVLKKRHIEVVAEVLYPRGTEYGESMKEQVQEVIKSGADVVISAGSYEACAAFIRDVRLAGIKIPIANLSFVGSDALLSFLLNEEKRTGKNLTFNLINSQVVPPWNDISYPLVNEYQKIVHNYSSPIPKEIDDPLYHGDDKSLNFTSLEGFLNAKVFVQILKKIEGEVTRKSFQEVAKKIKHMDVGLGKNKISFDNEANQGLNDVYYTTIDKNRFVIIKDWSKFK